MKQLSLLLILLNFVGVVMAQDIMRVAVLDLVPNNVDAGTAGGISDLLRNHLINENVFTVIERTEIDKILKEQEFQSSGCTETSCAVQIGRLITANYMLVGTVNHFGSTTTITVRIIDVEAGTGKVSETQSATTENDIPEAVQQLVKNLVSRIRGYSYIEPTAPIQQPTQTKKLASLTIKGTPGTKVKIENLNVGTIKKEDLILEMEFKGSYLTISRGGVVIGNISANPDGLYHVTASKKEYEKKKNDIRLSAGDNKEMIICLEKGLIRKVPIVHPTFFIGEGMGLIGTGMGFYFIRRFVEIQPRVALVPATNRLAISYGGELNCYFGNIVKVKFRPFIGGGMIAVIGAPHLAIGGSAGGLIKINNKKSHPHWIEMRFSVFTGSVYKQIWDHNGSSEKFTYLTIGGALRL